MPYITLLHGKNHILKKPDYFLGKSHNDYGRLFYCTENMEMARKDH